MKRLQCIAAALLLVLVAGCSSTTTDSGATEKPPGTIVIREHNVLRMSSGGVAEGTLIFLGWQHTFEVENMILGPVGRDSVELTGEVWNLETLEDFAGTYHPAKEDFQAGKGLSGVWFENENGVRVQVRTVGQDISVRVDSAGSVVTLK
ncbi:MAG: hypothetical protein ABJ171_05095 [Halieaceae bacterium]